MFIARGSGMPCREGGARCPVLLAPDLRPFEPQDRIALVAHQSDLFLGKAAREVQVAELIEVTDLFGGQLHAVPSANNGWARSGDCTPNSSVRRTNSPAISARQLPKRPPWGPDRRISRNRALSQQKCGFLAFLKGFGLM
jgi:hypothetical protein